MSTDSDPPTSLIYPRPGVLQTLGICQIVLAVVSGFCLSSSLIFTIVSSTIKSETIEAEVKVEVDPTAKGTTATTPGAGVPITAGFNPFMGMDDKNFVRFNLIDSGFGFLMNLLMFATGIGLLNRRYRAVQWWNILAWVRIVTACLIWSYYIVGVAPGFSETMAKEVLKMYASQGVPVAKLPPVGFFTRVYSIMNLFVAFGAMMITSAYPAISLWFLTRPGVKAAIVDPPLLELEPL